MTECNEYKKLNSNVKRMLILERVRPFLNSIIKTENLKKKMKHQMFNKDIQICKEKNYKFNSNDFCQTGLNCIEKIIKPTEVGYNYDIKKIDCKCPNENSLKCVKYCAEIKINKTLLSKVKKCGNDNVSILRSNFRFFESLGEDSSSLIILILASVSSPPK